MEARVVAIQDEQAERIDAAEKRIEEGVDATWMAFAGLRVVNERMLLADSTAMEAEARATDAVFMANDAMDAVIDTAMRLEDRIDALRVYSPADSELLLFEFDSDVLTPLAAGKLDRVLEKISGWDDYLIEVHGFTDGIGTEKYNVGLSEGRARAAMRYLVASGVPLHRIFVAGLGTANPVSSNATPEGREHNRRAEVRILWANEGVAYAEK
jgi:outer membrane protein OmpA-like peptidoglycan-associated protein